MQSGADGTGGTRSDEQAATVSVDPTVTLGLLIAALDLQRRTSLALYHLVRSVVDPSARPGRRENRGRERNVRRRLLIRPAHSSTSPDLLPALDSVGTCPPNRALVLAVRCFGRFEVLRDGVPISHWRRGKAKTLLKYLIVRRQPVPRDALIDLLWPEADPRTAVNGLRVALHALRQALGRCTGAGKGSCDYVIFDNGNYSINPAADLWIDADEFSSHFTTGLRLERQGQVAAAIAHYEQAEAVYRDDYLVEDLYEDWTLVRREELKDQYLMVLTKLADACLRAADAEGCIVRCHKILQKDACREDAYRRLMRCYAQLGQQSQALHWFEVCARTLRQELDVVPSDQTMELYHLINSGRRLDVAPNSSRRRAVRKPAGAVIPSET